MKKIVFALLAIIFTGLAIYLALDIIPNIDANQYLVLGIGVLSLLIASIMIFCFFLIKWLKKLNGSITELNYGAVFHIM